MKKRIISIFLLILTVCVALSSCNFSLERKRILTDFSKIKYERPNYQGLSDLIMLCKNNCEQGRYDQNTGALDADIDAIIDGYYYDLLTMSEIAFVNYSLDITNESLRDEYYSILEQSYVIYSRLEELYSVLAESKHADYLEEKFLGEGFFEAYKGGPVTIPIELQQLISRENELVKAYGEEMADLCVEYDGKIYGYNDISEIQDEELYNNVCDALYSKYNPIIGQIFVELVDVRNDIAKIYGYSTYAQYAYENSYGREYTPGEADAYMNDVKKHITPVYVKYKKDFEYVYLDLPRISPDEIVSVTSNIVSAMSPSLKKIYKQMVDKNLYSVDSSPNKYYGSFQTYFNEYETPYLFVNGNGIASDILAMLHEFGHFTSSYLNYGSVGSNDESEISSQTLELLGINYLDGLLLNDTVRAMKAYEMFYIISSINECAAMSAFENMVYSDTALTLDECNAYYENCAQEYGLIDENGEGADERAWVLINHLIEYPYYMIGYSVSADVALQIYELENAKKGDGVKTYLSLIKLAHNYDLFGNLKEVGLLSPFDTSRAQSAAAVFERALSDLKK